MVSLLEKKERAEERHFEEKERRLKDLKDSLEEYFEREGLAQRVKFLRACGLHALPLDSRRRRVPL